MATAALAIESRGLDFEAMSHTVWRPLRQELGLITQEIERDVAAELDERGINVSGDLKKSLHGEVEELARGLAGVVATGTSYDTYRHDGTDPHFPPYDPISDWVRDKLGVAPGTMEEQKVAWWDDENMEPVEFTATVDKNDAITRAIQHKIAREGTEGDPFMTDVYEIYRPLITSRLADRLASDLGRA